jgi:putative FmdB family regulatory protein
MPIYEYRRPDGTTFEIQQSFADDPLTVDPQSGVPVERVLHPPAVHFKGKGFYNTDYGTRARQRETAAAAEAGGSSDKAGSAEKGSSGAPERSSADGKQATRKPATEKRAGGGADTSPKA